MSASQPGNKEILLQATAQELGTEALETVKLSEVSKTVPEATGTLPSIPHCVTQSSIPQNLKFDPAAIMVGLQSKVPRWKPGSVVKWTAWRMGYASRQDAEYAAVHLSLAAEQWNKAQIGVTFEYVRLAKDASFVICHGGDAGNTLARAFFPNEDDLSFVYVYSAAFTEGWKENLWKVLTHELGHVLGLRHEFAAREGAGAVQFGEKNDLSVMNYRKEPPELQPSDIKATRDFYGLPVGTKISTTPIVDYSPM
ncbi:MAG: hypothetical protein L6R42_002636 [Xanthoria sp. 1 TBL-2021]|nr:MAG: hypothetical protein L6R42_002636 [Xanthoria sp. 1 TBL-2021]